MYKGLAVGYVISSIGFGGGQVRLFDFTELGRYSVLVSSTIS